MTLVVSSVVWTVLLCLLAWMLLSVVVGPLVGWFIRGARQRRDR